MSLMLAKCTQCGGNLQIDNEKEAAVCPYCGSAFIVEKAIQLYKFNADVVKVYGGECGRDSEDSLYETGLKALNARNIDLAKKCFEDIKKYYPSDWRGYWGMMMCYSKENIYHYIKEVEKEYSNAYLLVNEEQKQELINDYNRVKKEYDKQVERRKMAEQAADEQVKLEQIIWASELLKKEKMQLYRWLIECSAMSIPFFVSIICNFSYPVKVITGIIFVIAIIASVISGIPIIFKVQEAKERYKLCKEGKYIKESNW